VIIGYGFVYPTIFKHIKEMNMMDNLNIIGGWGFIAQNNLSNELKENVIIATPTYIMRKNKIAEQFVERFKKLYKVEPNFDSALAFENIWLITQAMKRSKSTNYELVAKTLSSQSYSGVMGKTYIDENGGLEIPMIIGVFKNGKIIKFE
jgi:ABC-type branched-subunit amino acid transport system substrate-binding protein